MTRVQTRKSPRTATLHLPADTVETGLLISRKQRYGFPSCSNFLGELEVRDRVNQVSGQDLASQENDAIVETISCPVDEPVASVDAETFDTRYERAVKIARTEFGDDMGKRRQFQRETRQGASIDRDYVVEELGDSASSVKNTDQQRTLARYQDIVETVSADQILDEFGNLRDEEVIGDDLVDAVVEIISRYNLEEKYEERQEWAEEQEEPPHVVAGMYLKSQR